MQRIIKSFFIAFNLIGMSGLMGDVPPPPPPPPLSSPASEGVLNMEQAGTHVERFIPLYLERALVQWENYDPEKQVKFEKNNNGRSPLGMKDVFDQIREGKQLRSVSDQKPKENLSAGILKGLKKKPTKLEFTKFFDPTKDEEYIDNICSGLEEMGTGYDFDYSGNIFHIDSFAMYEFLQKTIKTRIQELETEIEKDLNPIKEKMRELHRFVSGIFEQKSYEDYTGESIKRMKSQYLDESCNGDRFPKVLSFWASANYFHESGFIDEDQFRSLLKIKTFLEQNKAYEKIYQAANKKRFLEGLRKISNQHRPALLGMVTLQEAIALERLGEDIIRNKRNQLSEEDLEKSKKMVHNCDLEIYFLGQVTRKIEEIVDQLRGQIPMEDYFKYVSGPDNRDYVRNVGDCFDALKSTMEQSNKPIQAVEEELSEEIEETINQPHLFPLSRPEDDESIDWTQEVRSLLKTKVSGDENKPGSTAWAKKCFEEGLGDSYNIESAWNYFNAKEQAYRKTLKTAYKRSPALESWVGSMRLLYEKYSVLKDISPRYITGLRTLLYHCKEKIKQSKEFRSKELEKLKSAKQLLRQATFRESKKTSERPEDEEFRNSLKSAFTLVPAPIKIPQLQDKEVIQIKNPSLFKPESSKKEKLRTQIKELKSKSSLNPNSSNEFKKSESYKDQKMNYEKQLQGTKNRFLALLAEKEKIIKSLENQLKQMRSLSAENTSLKEINQKLKSENEILKKQSIRRTTFSNSDFPIIQKGTEKNTEAKLPVRDELTKKEGSSEAKARESNGRDAEILELRNLVANLQRELRATEERDKVNGRDAFGSERDTLDIRNQQYMMMQRELGVQQEEQERRARDLDARIEDRLAAMSKKDRSGNKSERILPNNAKVGKAAVSNNSKTVSTSLTPQAANTKTSDKRTLPSTSTKNRATSEINAKNSNNAVISK